MITMKITSKDIILDTDERIRMQSEPVQLPLSNEDRELLQAMLDYVRNSQNDEIAKAEDLQPAVGGSLTLTHSLNSQMSFMYGFFFVKFLIFTVVCVVIMI